MDYTIQEHPSFSVTITLCSFEEHYLNISNDSVTIMHLSYFFLQFSIKKTQKLLLNTLILFRSHDIYVLLRILIL